MCTSSQPSLPKTLYIKMRIYDTKKVCCYRLHRPSALCEYVYSTNHFGASGYWKVHEFRLKVCLLPRINILLRLPSFESFFLRLESRRSRSHFPAPNNLVPKITALFLCPRGAWLCPFFDLGNGHHLLAPEAQFLSTGSKKKSKHENIKFLVVGVKTDYYTCS